MMSVMEQLLMKREELVKQLHCVCSVMSEVIVCAVCRCLDPDLVYDKCLERDDGFENALDFFPPGHRPTAVQPEMSGEFLLAIVFPLGIFRILVCH